MKNSETHQSRFSYSYSAREQAEIKKIRDKYTPSTEAEDKMARLRKLDARVEKTAEIASISAGIIGSLLLGLGMSLIMSELRTLIGMSSAPATVLGIILSIIGGAIASLGYPIYHFVLKRERARVAPEIIKLSDELIQ